MYLGSGQLSINHVDEGAARHDEVLIPVVDFDIAAHRHPVTDVADKLRVIAAPTGRLRIFELPCLQEEVGLQRGSEPGTAYSMNAP